MVVFIPLRWGHSVTPWVSSRVHSVGWEHSDASWALSGSILLSFGSFGRALRVVGFNWFHWVHSVAPWGSLGPLWRVLGVVVLIWVRWVHFGAPLWSSRIVGLIRACHWHQRIISGSFERALVVVVFIRVRSGHLGAPWVSSGSFGLILARTGGRRVHSGWFGSFWRALVWFIRVRWVHSCVF